MIDAISPLFTSTLEIRRRKAISTVALTGIIAVEELSPEKITVATHSGRITVKGARLLLSVFEGRTIEISGKILGVEL